MYLQHAGHSPAHGGLPIEMRLLLHAAKSIVCGQLTVVSPDGTRHEFTGRKSGPHAVLEVHRPSGLRRVWARGDTGFAEAFMAGDIETPDLDALIELGALNEKDLSRLLAEKWWFRTLQRTLHFLRANTRRGARRNIAAHYDLGNDFYRLWLDESMTYSSGIFDRDGSTLSDAQLAKYDRIIDALGIDEHHHVLEVGCGWGGFAMRAAATRGCRVTGLTLSTEQLEWCRRAAARCGLDSLTEFRLQDYRDVDGDFDRVVSIEMFEAVGEAYWDVYFATIASSLRSDGQAMLQIITIDDEVFETYRRGSDFIQRYIFPGGMLAPSSKLRELATRHGLSVVDEKFYGRDYARTLEHWHDRFCNVEDDVDRLGFDRTFRRMWRYYFSYCRAGFVTGRIDLVQLQLARAKEAGHGE